jgi:hypothetical protein
VKTLSAILLIVSTSLIGFSQSSFNADDFDLDTSNFVFGVRSEAYSNSTSLTATVLNATFTGGYITPENKANILSRTQPINNSAMYWNTSLFFSQRIDSLFGKKKSKLAYFVNIADRQENLALFSENATLLILNGNKQFAGQSVSLLPLEFNQFQYKQFQVGINKRSSTGSYFSIGLSFLYGQKNTTGTSDQLDVLTSEYGDRLSTDAQFIIQQTEQNNTAPFNYNGVGASLDFVGKFDMYLLPDSTNPATFHFSVKDMGFINWHATSQETEIDTFYSYNGLYVENIFDPNSNISGDNPQDIFDSIVTKKNNAYTTIIPTTIHFYLEQYWNKWNFTLGGSHRINAYYYPYFYGKVGYLVRDKWMFSGQLNYGGYGNLGGGAEVKYITPNYNIRLGSSNLEGFMAPTKYAGQSVYVLLSFRI